MAERIMVPSVEKHDVLQPEDHKEQDHQEEERVLGVPMKAAWKEEDMLKCIGGVPPTLTARPLYVLKTMSGLNAYFDSREALEAGIRAWRSYTRQWFLKLLREAKDVKMIPDNYAKSRYVITSSNNGDLSRECPAAELPKMLAFIQSGCEPKGDIDYFLNLCIPLCDDAEIVQEKVLSTTCSV